MEENTFSNERDIYNKKIAVTKPDDVEIGVDTNNTFVDNIIEAGTNNLIDMSAINNFTQMSQRRDLIYSYIDDMGKDSTIASALEIYTEDATNVSESGRIVWCTSENNDVRNMVTFLLDSMNVDKNIYKWAYCLIKYGDVYLRLYRESEERDLLFDKKENKELNEDINVKAYSQNDKYTHYVEMIKNPAEMFELTKHGRTYGYIQAPTNYLNDVMQNMGPDSYTLTNFSYTFEKNNIDIYPATEFVHASLEENDSRVQESVNIFIPKKDIATNNNNDVKDDVTVTYFVKHGQSVLYNMYKVWRELSLLENSVLLNRVTKSSIVRIIGVEVGDMPKENVQTQLNKVKRLIEQKTAINSGTNMNEYLNPGPVENSVYIPTHGGQGAITTETIGGDVNVGDLTDLDYYKKKLFAGLKIPGQYLGDTDDATGFNGGSSLSIISSRYAKTVVRIQNALAQMITDAVNLMLLDKGLDNYVNDFTIYLTPPVTQEDIDRRDMLNTRIGIARDIMDIVDNQLDEQLPKIKILKSLLSEILPDSDIPSILEEQQDKLESTPEEEEFESPDDDMSIDIRDRSPRSVDRLSTEPDDSLPSEQPEEGEVEEEQPEQGEEVLPTADELNIDLT